MDRKEAIRKVKWLLFGLCYDLETRKALDMLIPDLWETEDEDEKVRKELMDTVRHAAGDNGVHISAELEKRYLTWLEKKKEQPAIISSPQDPNFNDSGDVMFGNPDDYKKDVMDYIEEGKQRGIKEVIENPEKYGLQESLNYVLCNNTMDKIQVYIANNFIADEVVKTDVKSIVKAMEEGVRIGIDAQKDASPFASCAKCSEYTRGYEDGKKLGLSQGYNNARTSMTDVEDITPEMKTEFEKQVSRIILSVLKGEHAYTTENVKYFAQALLGYAKSEMKSETPEWTEEDEKMAKFYDDDYNNRIGDMPMKDVVEMRLKFKDWIINRIKHIRSPYKEQWRPTKEQMNALRYLLDEYGPWFLSSVDARRELREMKNELEKEFGL